MCMKESVFTFAFVAASLFAQNEDDKMILSDQGKKMFAKENKLVSQAVNNDITKDEMADLQKKDTAKQAQEAAATVPDRGSSDIMIVDPNVVAKDWTDAFKALSDLKQTNLIFVLRDQSMITNIATVEAMPGGYLMLFTLKTVQGIKYRIVKTGDIVSLETK